MSEPHGRSDGEPANAARFTSRVDDYVRFRPGYPHAALDLLREHAGLAPEAVVADVGAGTGILTRRLAAAGALVTAVEPGAAMRARILDRVDAATAARVTVVDGTGEATGLPAASVDLVTVAQAFHWIDPARARTEFARITRGAGHVALLWNARRLGGTPFLEGYEALLHRHGTDYERVRHDGDAAVGIDVLFAGMPHERHVVPNTQRMTADDVVGRARSSSYAPTPGTPAGDALDAALRDLVDRTAAPDGTVGFDYDCEVWLGRLHERTTRR